MRHDTPTNPPDRPFRHAGIGMAQSFRCGDCDKHRQVLGRRLKKVRGLRCWVCHECAKRMEDKA